MSRSDHEAMLTCSCSEADRLTVLCLYCGRVHMPDPTYAVLILTAMYASVHLIAWAVL